MNARSRPLHGARLGCAVAFFRDLKSLLITGMRHPGGEAWSSDREADAVTAGAAAEASHPEVHHGEMSAGPSYPPGYVKAYDEGRPRK